MKFKFVKPSVTVAVCAYNEEDNIGNFIESVLAQYERTYVFRKLLVVSDGSTDKTNEILDKYKSKRVYVVKFKERKGKSSRLNFIYRNFNSDILIQSDADVTFAGRFVNEAVVRQMMADKYTMMIGGNPKPISGKTFIENSIRITTNVYRKLRFIVNGGNNVFSVDGKLLGFRREFIKTVTMPADMIGNDRYVYYRLRSKSLFYQFVPFAVVYYRLPSTVVDHVKQNTRFIAANLRMKKYFSEDLLLREAYIPRLLLLRSMFFGFMRFPLECFFISLLNNYCSFKAGEAEKALSGKWDVSKTTKLSVSNE